MSQAEESNRKRAKVVEALLREVVRLPDILFVMGKGPQAVMEAWVASEKTRVSIQEGWIAVESDSWHCHLRLTEIVQIRFVEEPDPHDPRCQAYSIRFLGMDGGPLLMIFFGKMYDSADVLLSERAACFRALKEKYGIDA